MKEVSFKSYLKENFRHPFRRSCTRKYESKNSRMYTGRPSGLYYVSNMTCFLLFYYAISKLQLSPYGYVLASLVIISSIPLGYLFTKFNVLDDDGTPYEREDSKFTLWQNTKGVITALLIVGVVIGSMVVFTGGRSQEYTVQLEQEVTSAYQAYEIAHEHATAKIPETGLMDYRISITGQENSSRINTHYSFYFVWYHSNFLFSVRPKTVTVYIDTLENGFKLFYDPEATYSHKPRVIFDELKVDTDLVLDVLHRATDFDRNEMTDKIRIRITPYLDEKESSDTLVSADDVCLVEINDALGDDYRYTVSLADGQCVLLED